MFLEESTDALPLAEVFWLISHRQDWQDDKCTTNTWGEGGGGRDGHAWNWMSHNCFVITQLVRQLRKNLRNAPTK